MVMITVVWLCYAINVSAQEAISLQGKVVDITSRTPLNGVLVKIENTSIFVKTNESGNFQLHNIPSGNLIIKLSIDGYEEKIFPINLLEKEQLNLGTLFLSELRNDFQDVSTISLTDDDLLDDNEQNSDYIAGLFQSSKDAYLRAAAFNFGQAWFKVRGYDSSYGTVSINGIEMNKLFDGRPQWSNWGGLNDVFRNREFSNGLAASGHGFGGILGTTNFITKASDYRKTTKVSMSSTNKSYDGRMMGTYASGLNKNDWAFVVSGSRRFANEGYIEGTSYNAWAVFLALEKKLNNNHSFNLTAFTASNRRGKSSPNTQEVYDLKGYKYNSYWGTQEGDNRNSRIKEIEEPVIMLSHIYTKENTSVQTTIAYQFGHIGNGRLGYFNAPNPDPTYWKNLPSNYLRFEDNLDYSNAYLAEQKLLKDGQLNLGNLYETNTNNGNSLYYLYEDKVDDLQISIKSNLNANLSDNIRLNASVSFKNLTSHNYGNMLDLLGGNGFVDLDQYAIGNAQQNNLNKPNRVVGVGDKFQYNYQINASIIDAFSQLQFTKKKVDYFVGLNFKNTSYQRNGFYKNGTYPENSFGKGVKQSFLDFSVKGAVTYKITGRHLLNINGAVISNAPSIRTSFSNSRVNNNVTPNLASEKIISTDASYIFRSPKIQSRLTAYYTKFSDAIETSFFFAEGLLGDQADFVNEIITGVDKKNIGAELSFEYQAIPSVKLIGVAGIGQFTYDNNPQLYLQSESFNEENSNFGIAHLKNYRVSGTPQRAYSLGFEYRDPKYWWFQVNANFLSNNYLDISPLLRTDNFYLDTDGVPFVDDKTGVEVTQNQVNSLLIQEKFDDAFLVNVVGGKSWKIKSKYIGVFMGINNVFGELFKTGGFEQSRNANYKELKQDKQLDKPIFGPKYWYGNDTSYYLNFYVRF